MVLFKGADCRENLLGTLEMEIGEDLIRRVSQGVNFIGLRGDKQRAKLWLLTPPTAC